MFVCTHPIVLCFPLETTDFPATSDSLPILDIHRRQLQARIEAEVPASTVNDGGVGDLENLGCAPGSLCTEGRIQNDVLYMLHVFFDLQTHLDI